MSKKGTAAENPVSIFKGILGKIELYSDKVVIKRGFLHKNGRSQKEIYLSSITAVQIKKPGLQSGYIQFVLSGSQEVKNKSSFGTELIEDPNTVLFNAGYKEAIEFKSQIEKLKHHLNSSSNIIQNQISIADELTKLKVLMDEGILTEEEFVIQKNKLLNK